MALVGIFVGFVSCAVDVDSDSDSDESRVSSAVTTSSSDYTDTSDDTISDTSSTEDSTESSTSTTDDVVAISDTSSFAYSDYNGIEINGITYSKTNGIAVIQEGKTATISMTTDNPDYKGVGVFTAGRNVQLSAFVIGQYEVTQELYEAVMGTNPSKCVEGGYNYKLLTGETAKLRPVDYVSWYDAVAFCNKLTKMVMSEDDCVYYVGETVYESGTPKAGTSIRMDTSKKGYRLPTEAEWEFAARGGDVNAPDWDYAYAGAQTTVENVSDFKNKNTQLDSGIDEVGWYLYNLADGTTGEESKSGNEGYGSHEVGLKKANRLGLYDMTGNISEWCYDKCGNITYSDSQYTIDGVVVNPLGPTNVTDRVRRGGSWRNSARLCSVSYRQNNVKATSTQNYVGFRLARYL